MPRKRDVLEALKRDELLAATDRFEVPVRDRRVRDELIDALGASRKAGLAGVLEGLSRDRLKEVCRALDLDDSGREKAAIIARLAGQEGHAGPPKPAAEVPVPSPRSPGDAHSAVEEGGGSLSRAAGEGRGGGLRPRVPPARSEERMEQAQLNWITGFIWNIADDVLRDLYVRGKYRDVILPMTVLRRRVVRQDPALRQAAGQGCWRRSWVGEGGCDPHWRTIEEI